MAERFRPGMRLKVVDLSDLRGPKRPPFAKGAVVTCAEVRPGHVAVKGVHGWWKAHRFAEAAGDE